MLRSGKHITWIPTLDLAHSTHSTLSNFLDSLDSLNPTQRNSTQPLLTSTMEPDNDSTQAAADSFRSAIAPALRRAITELEDQHPVMTFFLAFVLFVAILYCHIAFAVIYIYLRWVNARIDKVLASFPRPPADPRLGAPNDILTAIHTRLFVAGLITILKFICGDDAGFDWM